MKTAGRLWVSFTVFIALAGMMACTPQSRGEKWAQGQGNDLLAISAYDNKMAELTTQDVKSELKVEGYTKESKVFSAKGEKLHTYAPVNYTRTAPELKEDLVLKLKPQTKFDLKYKVEDKYLKIYLIASPTDVDKSMLTYGEEIADNKLEIPLIGFPITGFYRSETEKNADNEPTKRKLEISMQSRDGAVFFRVDWNAFEVFQALLKTDVFPINYFRGDWFFSETTLEHNEESTEDMAGAMHSDGFRGASLVKFDITDTVLKIVDINIDDRLREMGRDGVNYRTLVTIPVKTQDYRQEDLGRKKGMKETSDDKLDWNQKRWISIDFNEINSVSIASDKLNKLTGLEVADDFFSLTIFEQKTNKRVKLAFMRAKETNYKPKRVHPTDLKKFGYFTTSKNVIFDYRIRREEDVFKNTFINRFNPEPDASGKREIKFYLTTSSPSWTYEIAQRAVGEWNKTFEKAGTRVNVVLAPENDRKELGDIRYNQLNFIESVGEGTGTYGYGPSLANSKTGEIINAAANIYITSMRAGMVDEIRSYLRHKKGDLKGSYVEGLAIQARSFGIRQENADLFKRLAQDEKAPSKKYTKHVKNLIEWDEDKKRFDFKPVSIDLDRWRASLKTQNSFTVSSKNISAAIESQCPEVVAYAGTEGLDSDRELKVLESCSQSLVKTSMLYCLVHEMGHNFGLMHNFAGSVDEKNFPPEEAGRYRSQVSSAMEYPATDERIVDKPGLYDLAAIRFGYANTVEMEDGQLQELKNPDASIEQNLGTAKIRKFLYCDDYDAEFAIDPMCRRWDKGTSPMEVVDHLINDYNTTVALGNYRYDNFKIRNRSSLISSKVYVFKALKTFYDQWRLHLAQFLGEDYKYLEKMSIETYRDKLSQMEKHPEFSEKYKTYRPVATEIFKFFQKVAFLNDRFCVVHKKSGADTVVDLVNLPKLRDEIFFTQNVSIKTCRDSEVTSLLAKDGRTVVDETGYFMNEVRFDMSPKSIVKASAEGFVANVDIWGLGLDRRLAAQVMSKRFSDSLYLQEIDFNPNFLDEPDFREIYLQNLSNRIFKGISSQEVSAVAKESAKAPDFFPKFATEGDILADLYRIFYSGLEVPGNDFESISRRTVVEGAVLPNSLVRDQESVELGGTRAFVSGGKDSVVTNQVIKTVKWLRERENATDVSEAEAREIIGNIKGLLPVKSEQVSLADFMPAFKIIAGLLEDQKTSSGVRQWLTGPKMFLLEVRSLPDLQQSILQSLQGKENPKEVDVLEAAQKISLTDLYKKAGTEFSHFQESFEEKALKAFNDYNSKIRAYKENSTEYQGQLKLLHNVMGSY